MSENVYLFILSRYEIIRFDLSLLKVRWFQGLHYFDRVYSLHSFVGSCIVWFICSLLQNETSLKDLHGFISIIVFSSIRSCHFIRSSKLTKCLIQLFTHFSIWSCYLNDSFSTIVDRFDLWIFIFFMFSINAVSTNIKYILLL